MTIEEKRAQYELLAERDKESKYRREREYAQYVDRFLHSHESVDGMTYEQRLNKLPMPYNIYFG